MVPAPRSISSGFGVANAGVALHTRSMEARTLEQLEAGLDMVRESPGDLGRLELIVRRPDYDQRELLDEAELDLEEGLVGDMWCRRPSRHMPDGSPHPDKQVNLINVRAIQLIAGSRERWPLAGDQLYVDFDLSDDNAPPGTRLAIGTAVLEVTTQPHNGCAKFSERFGADALRFVNTDEGRALHLRGRSTRVVTAGRIRAGDEVKKL